MSITLFQIADNRLFIEQLIHAYNKENLKIRITDSLLNGRFHSQRERLMPRTFPRYNAWPITFKTENEKFYGKFCKKRIYKIKSLWSKPLHWHDDTMTWKRFPHYWPLRSPVVHHNWLGCGALMCLFWWLCCCFLSLKKRNYWTNRQVPGDFKRRAAHLTSL